MGGYAWASEPTVRSRNAPNWTRTAFDEALKNGSMKDQMARLWAEAVYLGTEKTSGSTAEMAIFKILIRAGDNPRSSTNVTRKELVVRQGGALPMPLVEVYNLMEHGRRIYRSLVYSSSPNWTLADLPGGGDPMQPVHTGESLGIFRTLDATHGQGAEMLPGTAGAARPLAIVGATGKYADNINGKFLPVGVFNGKPLFQKEGDLDKWLYFYIGDDNRMFWLISATENKDQHSNFGWACSSETQEADPCQIETWKVFLGGSQLEEQPLTFSSTSDAPLGNSTSDRQAGSEFFIPARLLFGLLPQALLDEYDFWQTTATGALVGHAKEIQDTPFRIEVLQEAGRGIITKQQLLSHHGSPNPDCPVLKLCNLVDVNAESDVGCLARYLLRLDTRAHVLVRLSSHPLSLRPLLHAHHAVSDFLTERVFGEGLDGGHPTP